MKAEQVIITHDSDSFQMDCTWSPNVENLPKIVRREMDKDLNKEQKIRRRKIVIKTLMMMAEENRWTVLRKFHDDDKDESHLVYKIV